MTDYASRIAYLERIKPTKIIIWTLLFLGGIVMVTPLAFMISTSFKTGADVFSLGIIPKNPTLENYLYIWTESQFSRWMLNSLWVATFSTASVVFFDSLVGYTLAKFTFRGQTIVFIAILSTLMIPTEMLIIPWYMMSREFGWIDTYWGIAFPGLMTGFGTFLMRQFFMGLPDELIEAARIDGWSEFAIWSRIAMPLVVPALSALAIFHFLGNWTAFIWPLIVTNSPELYTIPVGLASFNGEFQTDWEIVMTASCLATLPTLLVFLVLQKFIIRGVMLAGLKG
ncbi:carbohydrate ABC transporter permease [bacterium]|nr:sugar ABC transporter permease [Paracoccaceae bacterium]MDC0468808.1 carbohydrate ABC transporter permease [bacterium]MBC8409089.1 carbohydrate ABC transporter permease [Paracoccaceae bacterium]MBT4285495.1 carbohydrate ABC transporter permease [Paracoccaceae bacterium]MBT4778103.1 carbohydrate ABC transporter permease [Paracoccaceae bacterium]